MAYNKNYVDHTLLLDRLYISHDINITYYFIIINILLTYELSKCMDCTMAHSTENK